MRSTQKNDFRPTHSKGIPARGILLLVGGIILIFFFAGAWLFSQQVFTPPTISGCISIDRSSYGINPAIFDELPAPTKCALSSVQAFRDGSFHDPFFFSREDYLQPEFYGNFESEGIKYWTAPTPNYYGAVGFGAFPQEQVISLLPGESKRMRVFLHAGYGIRTTQGMSLHPRYGHPLDAERVQVELPEDVRTGFILGPSFPKFSKEWARPIEVEISVSPHSAPGTITISFVSNPPDSQAEAAFRGAHALYFNATDYIGSQVPFQIQVRVLPKNENEK